MYVNGYNKRINFVDPDNASDYIRTAIESANDYGHLHVVE